MLSASLLRLLSCQLPPLAFIPPASGGCLEEAWGVRGQTEVVGSLSPRLEALCLSKGGYLSGVPAQLFAPSVSPLPAIAMEKNLHCHTLRSSYCLVLVVDFAGSGANCKVAGHTWEGDFLDQVI